MTKQRIKQLLPTETFHIDLVYAYDDVSSRRIIAYVKIRSPRCDRSRMGIGKITITDLVKNYLVRPIVYRYTRRS